MRLSASTIDRLPSAIARPPRRPDAGIVHLGIGAFHRAHQAVFVEDAMAADGGDWGIVGVSLRSAEVRDRMAPQDCLYTMTVRDGEADTLRVVGSVVDVIVAATDPAALHRAIAAPATRIVSLTVTEKGYGHSAATGHLDTMRADIAADQAAGAAPATTVGHIVAGLAARKAAGSGSLTLMSCDNLAGNGEILKAVIRDFAGYRDDGLCDWIEANCTFPSTMVDRIVPATTDADIEELRTRTGLIDRAMVKTEPFAQWVIEDRFAAGRPALEAAGVQLVDNVRPYEMAKLRMLNGSHSTLAMLGLMAGHRHVHAAIADPLIRLAVERLMRREAAATLPPVAGFDLQAYATALLARFANPTLEHALAQIATDSSQKLPLRLLATIRDCRAIGLDTPAAEIGIAAWIMHIWDGSQVQDPMATALLDQRRLSSSPVDLAERLLGISAIFGTPDNALTTAILAHVDGLSRHGLNHVTMTIREGR